MDKLDVRKITRNLVAVKERVAGDLDAIIDRLIEEDKFTIQTKEEIDSATPPTADKKSAIFVNKLLKCGRSKTFECFKQILAERGFEDLVETMEQTDGDSLLDGASGWSEERGRTFVLPAVNGDGEAEGGATVDQQFQRMATFVKTQFDEKEDKIKADLRQEFEQKLVAERRQHEETLSALQKDVAKLAKISEEYEHLKVVQKSLRKTLDDQHTKVVLLNKENVVLKREVTKVEALTTENRELKAENDKLKSTNRSMTSDVTRLKAQMADKEDEIEKLKIHIDHQYKRLKSDMTVFGADQESLQAGLKKQHVILTEIAKAVNIITKTMDVDEDGPANRGSPSRSTPRSNIRPFVGGKTTPRSSYNKYVNNLKKK